MYPYSLGQWLFLFYFYSFMGWCVESTHVSIRQKPPHWVNRGFMRGPFLPLYGSGAIMMLVVSAPFQHNLFLTYAAGCICASMLEYITGVTMEALFKVRYWDYSEQPFNFQGQICLGTTLAWGALTILMTQVMHRPVEYLLYMIPQSILSVLVFVLTLLVDADYVLSFRAALDIRDILIAMEKVKEEMVRIQERLDVLMEMREKERAHMQKRLDVIIAVREEEIEQYRSAAEMRIEELAENIERKLQHVRERIQLYSGEHLESAKNEALEIRDRFLRIRYRAHELKTVRDSWKRSMLLGNPMMKGTKKLQNNLEELKEAVKLRFTQ